MAPPVWETLLLDAGGTLVTLAVGAVAAWLAHRTGKLAPVYGRVGAWLLAHSGAIETDAEKVAQALVAVLVKRGAVVGVGIPQPAPLQGDAGFHDPSGGVDTAAVPGGGAGGQLGGGGAGLAPGGTAGPPAWNPRG